MGYVAQERIGFRRLSALEARRFSSVAGAALRSYDVAVRRCRLLAAHSNVVFRVDTDGGETFALRVGVETEDKQLHTRGELALVEAVARGTDVAVSRPLRNRMEEPITVVEAEGGADRYQCVLFTWLSGVPLAARLSSTNYRRLGELAAALHEFGAQWQPPFQMHPLVWDRVFYYSSIPVVLFDPRHNQWMTPARRSVAERALELATAELARLHRDSAAIYLHGNIEMWNVMVHRGRLSLLDFEDFMHGPAVQDIATTLHYGRVRPEYPSLCAAFRVGYENRAAWPVEYDMQLDTLMAARTLMLMNHALATHSDPGAFVARASRQLARFVSRADS